MMANRGCGGAGPSRRDAMAAIAMACAMHPAAADTPALQAAMAAFIGEGPLREGRVHIELAELVENGNAVPVTLSIDSPMLPADHVTALALFTERNPQPDVAVFRLGPHAGKASVSTRMRLATSQKVVAVARLSDGSCWTKSVEVIVTLAACVET